jgi:hypothetical protein
MRRAIRALDLVAILIIATGCASAPAPSPPPSPLTATPSVSHVDGTPFPDPIPDIPMTPCPGVAWPPANTDPGGTITVNWWYGSVIPGSVNVRVTNGTSEPFLVLTGDPPSGAAEGPEECRVHSPAGSGGIVKAGSAVDIPVLPVGGLAGVYVYPPEPCPEGCRLTAIGWMLLPPAG